MNLLYTLSLIDACQVSNLMEKYCLELATLRIVWVPALLSLLTYARKNYLNTESYSGNVTLSCVYHENPSFLSDTLDYKWTVLLEIGMALSDIFVLIGATEFYCAQVPYSMKGLVAGIVYSLIAFFMVTSQVIALPFKLKSVGWGTGTLSCGFWNLLTSLIYIIISAAAFALVARWYKNRKREDVLPNEHIFAEQYYSTKY